MHVSEWSGMQSCAGCGVPTSHAQQKKPNHVLHLLLSIFTVRLWLPVWAAPSLPTYVRHGTQKKLE